jgi:uncharacterized protein YciI
VAYVARFVLEIKFKDDEKRLQVRPAHRAFLAERLAERKLVTAGPWADDSGALLVFEADSEAELRELLAADPYRIANVYDEVSLREWQPIFP